MKLMPNQVNYSQDIVTPEVRMTLFCEAHIDKLLTAVREVKTKHFYKKTEAAQYVFWKLE